VQPLPKVSVLLCTVTFYANLAHSDPHPPNIFVDIALLKLWRVTRALSRARRRRRRPPAAASPRTAAALLEKWPRAGQHRVRDRPQRRRPRPRSRRFRRTPSLVRRTPVRPASRYVATLLSHRCALALPPACPHAAAHRPSFSALSRHRPQKLWS
jgi:hypothetical protein